MSDDDADAEAVRRMLRGWLAVTVPADPAAGADQAGADPAAGADPVPCTGLDVPEAEASTVVEAVRAVLGLAATPGGGLRPEPPALSAPAPAPAPAGPRALSALSAGRFAELRLLAWALVVEEHPSAARWTAEERLETESWCALLLERCGEDGTRRMVAALREESRPGPPAGEPGGPSRPFSPMTAFRYADVPVRKDGQR
nr:hypothetical protein OG409_02800 [Streptomyces sp. NBC_00974]